MRLVENNYIGESCKSDNSCMILNTAPPTYIGDHNVYYQFISTIYFTQAINQFPWYSIFNLSYSKIEWLFQKFEQCLKTFSIFDFYFNHFKDRIMSNQALGIGVTIESSTKAQQELNKNIKNSTNIYRSKWAKKFIQTNKLEKNSFSKKNCFKILSLKDQQAIRYQMRQVSTKNINRVGQRKKYHSRDLSFSYKAISLIPVLSSEILIILLSTQFYVALGFETSMAQVLAICVELFYMIFSSLNKLAFRVLKCLFLAYSIFTVAYSTYQNDSGVKNYFVAINKVTKQLEEQVTSVKNKISLLKKERASLLTSMSIYQKHHLISKGYAQLAIPRKINEINLERAIIEKNKSIVALRKFIFKSAKEGSFSKNAFSAIQLPTIIIIVGFFLIQISTSFLITDAIGVLKYIMPQFKFIKGIKK